MNSGIDKDVEVKDTAEEHSTNSENTKPDSMSKDEAKKFYEEKGLDLSPDVPVKPKPIPAFEKSLADKILSKFGDKIRVDYVRSDRIRVTTKREDVPNPGSDATRTPSLRDVFYSVEFHERECFEMFGVYFEGHPDMRRLLLPEDWADIPPFRKDFKIKGR